VIDFHCHLDLFPEPSRLIEEVDVAGIYVLAVTTTPKSWGHLQTLLRNRKRIRSAIGLHPELVAERASEVEEVCSIMTHTRYVGEVGLDGSLNFRNSFQLQQRVFGQILRHSAKLGGKILSVHSRGAASDVLDALSTESGFGTAVLHWFSGSNKELERAIDLGCWFSVGPSMLNHEKGRNLASKMPKDKVLTESDGPFARLGTCAAKPDDVSIAEERLASIWKLPLTEARIRILHNFHRLIA
jgi:TatD DNase family protein